MIKALERRGIPLSVVMAGVVVDPASCYATYVHGLGVALVIHLVPLLRDPPRCPPAPQPVR